jgi:hypothetical protein
LRCYISEPGRIFRNLQKKLICSIFARLAILQAALFVLYDRQRFCTSFFSMVPEADSKSLLTSPRICAALSSAGSVSTTQSGGLLLRFPEPMSLVTKYSAPGRENSRFRPQSKLSWQFIGIKWSRRTHKQHGLWQGAETPQALKKPPMLRLGFNTLVEAYHCAVRPKEF